MAFIEGTNNTLVFKAIDPPFSIPSLGAQTGGDTRQDAMIGDIHHWSTGDYKKVSPDEWVPVDEESESQGIDPGMAGPPGGQEVAPEEPAQPMIEHSQEDARQELQTYESLRAQAQQGEGGLALDPVELSFSDQAKTLIFNQANMSSKIEEAFSSRVGSEDFRQAVIANIVQNVLSADNDTKKSHVLSVKVLLRPIFAYMTSMARSSNHPNVEAWAAEKHDSLQEAEDGIECSGRVYLSQYSWALMPFAKGPVPLNPTGAWFAGAKIFDDMTAGPSSQIVPTWVGGATWISVVGPLFFKYLVQPVANRIAQAIYADQANMTTLNTIHGELVKDQINPQNPSDLDSLILESSALLALSITYGIEMLSDDLKKNAVKWDTSDLDKLYRYMHTHQR